MRERGKGEREGIGERRKEGGYLGDYKHNCATSLGHSQQVDIIDEIEENICQEDSPRLRAIILMHRKRENKWRERE